MQATKLFAVLHDITLHVNQIHTFCQFKELFKLINYSRLGFFVSLLPAKISFILDPRSIIPAGLTKLFKLQSGDIEKLLFEHINKEFLGYPYTQVGLQKRLKYEYRVIKPT